MKPVYRSSHSSRCREVQDMIEENKSQTILIVDDVIENLNKLEKLLMDEWVIKVAQTGKAALKIAASYDPPDLILMEVMMSDMDGYTVCRRLKESPEMRDIPVIFVTAMNREESEAHGLELGAIDYISKPYSAPVVKARIRNHLELKRYRDVLKHATMIDGLTGIANRRRFDETLPIEWRRAYREGVPLTLLMVDIDYFKLYNDTYGHQEGDECLRKVAATLPRMLKRPGDLAARYGGEEFACIIPGADASGAKKIGERIRNGIRALEIKHETSKIDQIVTVSVGAATKQPDGEEGMDRLVRLADQALYQAKQKGRDKFVFIQVD